MTYVDSIKLLGSHSWNNSINKREAINGCNELIKSHQESITLLKESIDESEKQIEIWKKKQFADPVVSFYDEIELVKIIVDFYRLNGRLSLIELDVNTAFKYIFLANTDYEYRFFARRIYTIMYETSKGLAIPMGQMYTKLLGLVEDKDIDLYKNNHGRLVHFLNSHADEFKEVRNANEAHKFKDFETQLESIEKSVSHVPLD